MEDKTTIYISIPLEIPKNYVNTEYIEIMTKYGARFLSSIFDNKYSMCGQLGNEYMNEMELLNTINKINTKLLYEKDHYDSLVKQFANFNVLNIANNHFLLFDYIDNIKTKAIEIQNINNNLEQLKLKIDKPPPPPPRPNVVYFKDADEDTESDTESDTDSDAHSEC